MIKTQSPCGYSLWSNSLETPLLLIPISYYLCLNYALYVIGDRIFIKIWKEKYV